MYYTFEQVKKDLSAISRSKQSLTALIRARSYVILQLEILKSNQADNSVLRNQLVETEKRLLSSLANSVERDTFYIQQISRLAPIHRTIIIEHFISNKPMWKVGELVGYSTRQANEHLKQAIKELQVLLNEKI